MCHEMAAWFHRAADGAQSTYTQQLSCGKLRLAPHSRRDRRHEIAVQSRHVCCRGKGVATDIMMVQDVTWLRRLQKWVTQRLSFLAK